MLEVSINPQGVANVFEIRRTYTCDGRPRFEYVPIRQRGLFVDVETRGVGMHLPVAFDDL